MKISENGSNSFSDNKKTIELLKNTGIIGIGRAGTYIISFLLLPIYTSYLSPESYGSIELVNNYVSLLATVVTLQIEQGCFRYLIDNDKQSVRFHQIISTSFCGLIIQIIVSLLIIIVGAKIFNLKFAIFITINTIANSVLILLQQISRGCGNNKYFAISGLIATIVAMACSCINVIIMKWNEKGVLIASFISYLVAIIYLYKKNQLVIRILEFRCEIYTKILKYSIPLIANSVSWWIFNVSDRTIINVVMDLSYTGIYSIANKFPGIGMTLYSVFNTAWTETVSRYISNKNSQKDFLIKSMTRVYGIFSTIVFGFIAVMPIIFPIFINKKYSEAYNQIPILFLSVLAYGVSAMYGALYIALKETKRIALTSFLAAVINFIINIAGIKRFGLFAASTSTFVSYFILALYRGNDIKRDLNVYIIYKVITCCL